MGTRKGYVRVSGKMEVLFTVELPIEHAHEAVACDDPAVEAAMQGFNSHVSTYLWGQDKPAASVYLEVNESDVEVEEDEREY